MKRLLALMLAAMMIMSLFSACSSSSSEDTDTDESSEEESSEEEAEESAEESSETETEEESEEDTEDEDDASSDVIDHGIMSANGEVPIVEETMEFDIACRQVSNVSDMDTNSFVVWLEEQTNIHINYDMLVEESLTEKTNLILASGELPEAFQYSSIDTTQQVKYGAQGLFVNLAPYFDEFGYYSTAAYEATDYLPNAITTPTGEIYCIAGVNECYHCFHWGRAWINQVWLDDLGLEYPETTDELHDVLEAFITSDPNGNGDDDEIGMLGSGYTNGVSRGYVADFLLESFIYDDYDMLTAIQDGHVTYMATTDEYREGLTLVRDWVDEGLIDSEFLSLTADEIETLGMQDTVVIGVFVGSYWWNAFGQETITDSNGEYRERNYTALSNVEGPDGTRNTLTTPEGVGGNLVITSACEYPEVLFRWADFQMSDEASIRAYAGSYEESVSEADEDALGINKEPALYKVSADSSFTTDDSNEACDNVAISNKSAAIRLGMQTDWDDEDAYWDTEVRLYWDTYNYYVEYDAADQYVPTLVMNEDDANRVSELESPIQTYQREWLGYFTLGQEDIDDDDTWQSYVDGFEGYELDEYIELLDSYYQAAYGEE